MEDILLRNYNLELQAEIRYRMVHRYSSSREKGERVNWNEQALTWLADSDRHLANSDAMLTELEERLANTPKPSEVLEWPFIC